MKGWTDLTPASLTLDEPATFTFDDQIWEPRNYDGLRRRGHAAARARDVAQSRHDSRRRAHRLRQDRDAVAAVGVGTTPRGLSLDHAGRLRADADRGGAGLHASSPTAARCVRSARSITCRPGRRASKPAASKLRPVARSDTTYLVTNMMRSVLNEGTGAGARAAGFALDAAGKSGTTNDLRDAWFVGFTPRAADGRLGRLRRQSAARPERLDGGAADLDRLHEGRARRPSE